MANRNLFLLTAIWAAVASCGLCDSVTFIRDRKNVQIEGNILLEDQAGNLLLEGRDGQQYTLMAPQIIKRVESDTPVKPYLKDQLRVALLAEYGPNFKALSTANYMIIYSCDTEYAKEASRLFEKAFSVFRNYFTRNGFKMESPKHPLVAIIMASREEYLAHVAKVIGPSAAGTAGVYVGSSNRMYMYDAFGGKTGKIVQAGGVQSANAEGFALMLKEQNITVIIHEAVHQLAYNMGFHNRQVIDNPSWLVEGMAMYFETPDLDARGGWKGVGNINRDRLDGYKRSLSKPISLNQLVLNDDLFASNDHQRVLDAYAMSWAFTYYLAKSRSQSYNEYLHMINARPIMQAYTPEERLADFRKAFGKPPDQLEIDFRRYMSRM